MTGPEASQQTRGAGNLMRMVAGLGNHWETKDASSSVFCVFECPGISLFLSVCPLFCLSMQLVIGVQRTKKRSPHAQLPRNLGFKDSLPSDHSLYFSKFTLLEKHLIVHEADNRLVTCESGMISGSNQLWRRKVGSYDPNGLLEHSSQQGLGSALRILRKGSLTSTM